MELLQKLVINELLHIGILKKNRTKKMFINQFFHQKDIFGEYKRRFYQDSRMDSE